MVTERPAPSEDELQRWCLERLSSGIDKVNFRSGHLSSVVGVRLREGREVVVKVRPGSPRLDACFAVQSRLFERGFACPEPLIGPARLERWVASAEAHVPGGAPMPSSGRAPEPFARGLAELVRLAPTPTEVGALRPNPPWNAWDHDEGRLWPRPDDWNGDLNDIDGPAWLDGAAAEARRQLALGRGPEVLGHGDWYGGNLRWDGTRLLVAHDWDSVIVGRLGVIAGFASADFATNGAGTEPSVEESATFLDAFAEAHGTPLDDDARRDAWASGLWLLAFNAKKQVAKGEALRSLDEAGAAERLERLRR
ncbi:MAG: phosphotransferase [Dehalococcoidia bacterium]